MSDRVLPVIVLCAAALCAARAVSAAEPPRAPAVSVPAAPPARAASDFEFLVGTWTLDVRPKVSGLAALIHGQPKLLGRWTARRQPEGIDDEFSLFDPSGNPRQTLRTQRRFDARTGLWQVSSTDDRGVVRRSTGRWTGTAMQVDGSGTQPDGTPYRSRTRFFRITADAFQWQQDRSTDEGSTWDEAVLVIEARRVPTPTPAATATTR